MDPFGQQQGPPNMPPNNFGGPGQFGGPGGNFGGPKKDLPNATAVLVLGIVSLVFTLLSCIFSPVIFVGLITSIISLAISPQAVRMHRAAPNQYNGWGNVQAGRIMAIISLSLFGVALLFFLIVVLFYGAAFSAAMSGGPWR